MIKSNDNEFLGIDFISKTVHVSYSVADFDGNVVKRGAFNDLSDNMLSIKELSKGFYTLCIIDGDSLKKSRFQKQ